MLTLKFTYSLLETLFLQMSVFILLNFSPTKHFLAQYFVMSGICFKNMNWYGVEKSQVDIYEIDGNIFHFCKP